MPLENWDAEDAYVAGASRSEQNLGRKAELRDGRNGERETYGFVRSGVKIDSDAITTTPRGKPAWLTSYCLILHMLCQ